MKNFTGRRQKKKTAILVTAFTVEFFLLPGLRSAEERTPATSDCSSVAYWLAGGFCNAPDMTSALNNVKGATVFLFFLFKEVELTPRVHVYPLVTG